MTRFQSLAWVVLPALFVATPLRAAELPAYLPPDTEILVSVNVRQVVDSRLFKETVSQAVRDVLTGDPSVQGMLTDLGFDPLKDLDHVLAASPGGTEDDRGLVVFTGRFDVAKFRKAADQALRDHPDVVKAHTVTDGKGAKVLVYQVNAPDPELPLFVSVVDKNTILLSPGKDYVVDALKKIGKAGKPTLRNASFAALLEKMDLDKGVALAAVGSALTRGGGIPEGALRDALNRVEAVGGGVTVGAEVEVEVVVAAKNDDQGRQLKATADNGLKQAVTLAAVAAAADPRFNPVFEMVRSVRIRLKGKVVTFQAQIDAKVFEDLLNPDE